MIVYDLLYFLLLLAGLPLWIKMMIKPEYRRILKNRLNPQIKTDSRPALWIHAVSVGEVRSLDQLLRRLLRVRPNIYLSVSTPSGFHHAREKYPGIKVINAPLDFSFVVKKYLDRIQPDLIVLNELEVWPNWIRMAKKRGIRVLLINGRISRRAYRMYRLFRFLLTPTFARIDRYLIQSDFYRDKFCGLRIPESKITVTGNIKADQAAALRQKLPPAGEIFRKLRIRRSRKKIIVAASTHLGDEKVLQSALDILTPRFALIVVPRHPARTPSLQAALSHKNIPVVTWSSADNIDLDRQVLLYDRIGMLFDIMSIADRVIMGGTYEEKVGGHNLYEPLALEKPIFGGPCYNNFPDIGTALVKTGIYHICANSRKLAEGLLNFRESATLVKTARRIFNSRTGSVEWTLQEIKRNLS